MPTLCRVEQERFSSSSQHPADTQAKGLGITLNKERGRGSYVAPGATGEPRACPQDTLQLHFFLKIDTNKTVPKG